MVRIGKDYQAGGRPGSGAAHCRRDHPQPPGGAHGDSAVRESAAQPPEGRLLRENGHVGVVLCQRHEPRRGHGGRGKRRPREGSARQLPLLALVQGEPQQGRVRARREVQGLTLPQRCASLFPKMRIFRP